MIKDPQNPDGPKQRGSRPSGEDRQEQHQRATEQAPADDGARVERASTEADPDNNLGRGAPGDRDDRIRHRAHEMWKQEGRPDGQTERHWHRAVQDLDREDAEIQGEEPAGRAAGTKTPSSSRP
jgi:hypothetical protein